MDTDTLFTEENLAGMKKLLKRICEGNPDSPEDEVKYCLYAMYDTINSELINEKKMEERMTSLVDADGGTAGFCITSGLRYTPLIFFSKRENGQTYCPSLVYEGIEGDGVETEVMPVYTRKKLVSQDFSDYRWHHTDLDTVLADAKESGFVYVVVNPDTTPVLLNVARTEITVSFFDDIDKCIDDAMAEGFQAEDLFPALVEKFYFRNVKCTLKDGSAVCGLALVPEDDTLYGLELETDADEDIVVRIEDLAFIRTPDGDSDDNENSEDSADSVDNDSNEEQQDNGVSTEDSADGE